VGMRAYGSVATCAVQLGSGYGTRIGASTTRKPKSLNE
jgi:hypothetical protein